VDVLVTLGGVPAALAAKAATSTIPIVFLMGNDPIRLGLVMSLNRPGGNITGVTTLASVVIAKQFEVLREVVGKNAVINLLVNPAHPMNVTGIPGITKAVGELLVSNASSDDDFEGAFREVVQRRAGGLVIEDEPFLNSRLNQLAALA